jgi:hypothetical protein
VWYAWQYLEEQRVFTQSLQRHDQEALHIELPTFFAAEGFLQMHTRPVGSKYNADGPQRLFVCQHNR